MLDRYESSLADLVAGNHAENANFGSAGGVDSRPRSVEVGGKLSFLKLERSIELRQIVMFQIVEIGPVGLIGRKIGI